MGVVDTCASCIGCFVLGFILSPLILQATGMFGSDWVPGKNCKTISPKIDCCTVKNTSYYGTSSRYHHHNYPDTCSPPFSLSDLDSAAYQLHAGAFAIMMLPIVFGCFEIWCSKDGDDDIGCCGYLGGFCFMLYPIAGLLSFIGCMIIAAKFPGSSFGQSFFLCLSSGLYVLAITGILIFYICYRKRNKKPITYTTTVQQYPASGAAAPYDSGPQVQIEMQSHTIEQQATVYNPETGGFTTFMKSINVFHLVMHRS